MSKRSYGQYCALARALDIIGDRWALLIVRNLLLGPLSWSALRDTLPGIAKNLLASRLADMQTHEILQHDGERYSLTEKGAELEAVVFAIGNWGEKHAFGRPLPSEAIRGRYFMTSLRRKLRPTNKELWIQLWVDEQPYAVRLGPRPTVVHGERLVSTTAHGSLANLHALLTQQSSLAELQSKGLEIEGRVSDLKALVASWPPALAA